MYMALRRVDIEEQMYVNVAMELKWHSQAKW
jgi:hypothetical protein